MNFKKTIATLFVSAFVTATIFTACDSAQKNVDDAEKNLTEAQQDLVKAKQDSAQARQDSVAAIEAYKIKSAEKIIANETRIAELKASTAKQNKALQDKNNAKIAALEQKNNNLKNEVANYNQSNQETWSEFRIRFDREMGELGESLNNLMTDKK